MNEMLRQKITLKKIQFKKTIGTRFYSTIAPKDQMA